MADILADYAQAHPPVEREEDICSEKKFNPIKHDKNPIKHDKEAATAASEVIFMPLSCPHHAYTYSSGTSNPLAGPRILQQDLERPRFF